MTAYLILTPEGQRETRQADLPDQPHYTELAEIIRPLLDHAFFEHVSVLHEGKPHDMFVDETGALKGLRRNEAATTIYRNNWMTQHPECDPESLPAIYGTAVLFLSRVWF